jgi:ribose transport system ATP-binding protein
MANLNDQNLPEDRQPKEVLALTPVAPKRSDGGTETASSAPTDPASQARQRSTSLSVEMIGISKKFGGVQALKDVTFNVRPGEIHALVGENGAGKSTLMKVLSGAVRSDQGLIRIGGRDAEIVRPHTAHTFGIRVIYQEMVLAPDLTVAENISLDRLGKVVDWAGIRAKAKAILTDLGFSIDPGELVRRLPMSLQQVVEIAKALSTETKVLVLDEPTAVLTPKDADRLLELVRTLARRGVSIIYISHRLEEVFAIADRVTVLKDGQTVATRNISEVTSSGLIDLMIGRPITQLFPKSKRTPGEEVLRVEHLRRDPSVKGISFGVRAREILGIAGLVGSGRTETVRALFGADRPDSGRIYLHGQRLHIHSPKDAVKAGIALIPEDRKTEGVVLGLPLRENMTLPSLNAFTSWLGVIPRQKERSFVDQRIKELRIRTPNGETAAGSLSGGNQQKVVLAKWMSERFKVILFDEPTRGVDVGAKAEIYQLIEQLAERGVALVIISSELLEIIGLSDRVLVMNQGRVTGLLDKNQISERNIMELAFSNQPLEGSRPRDQVFAEPSFAEPSFDEPTDEATSGA